jgi:hypothetical protein
MAHIENAARIYKWGLYAHHWADTLPDRKDVSNRSVMQQFGRRKHRKFVNLYFGTHTAMQHVLTQGGTSPLDEKDLVFLRFIADDLFVVGGAKFSDGNVAVGETEVYFADEDSMKLDNLGWNVILCQKRGYKGAHVKRLKMAELLVPHYISPSQIHSAIVLNSDSEEKLISLIEKEDSREFLDAMEEIADDSEFKPSFDPPEEPNMEIEIIRDGERRHFFGYGDGDGGYRDPLSESADLFSEMLRLFGEGA